MLNGIGTIYEIGNALNPNLDTINANEYDDFDTPSLAPTQPPEPDNIY